MSSVFRFPIDEKEKSGKQWKEGTRVIGVAESFEKNDRISFVTGIIMRGDLRIDGVGFCNPTIGGWDSTDELIRMFKNMERKDIHAWMLGGCVISWFNPVDINRLAESTGIPVVCVSYEPSEGLDKYVREYFPDDWQQRMGRINAIGSRERFTLDSGFDAFVACSGIKNEAAQKLVNLFTSDGRIPEPIRIAKLVAAEVRKRYK